MKNNKKAFLLIEQMTIIAFLSVLTFTLFFSYRNFQEKRDLTSAKIEIINAFSSFSVSSINFKKRYIIEFSIYKKEMKILDFDKIIKTIPLPKKLSYYSTHNSPIKSFHSTSFTKNGNLSSSFSIYIFNYNKKAKYKISFYNFEESKFLKINVYKNIKAKNLTLNNIQKYHDITNDNRTLFYSEWVKEI